MISMLKVKTIVIQLMQWREKQMIIILRKLIVIVLTATLFIASLAACEGESAKNEVGSTDGSFYSAKFEDGKYVEPVTISTVFPVSNNVKFKNGENLENNVHTKWAKETLGIDINYLWTVNEQNNSFSTKIRLMLTSGQEMPDIIALRGDTKLINDLIDSGQFSDAGALFDKYASDSYKAAMAEDTTVWDGYIRDGVRMAIPILENAFNNDPVMYIREDWLNNMNLKAPKTLEELEIVLEAFTNGDPDGNNKKDTIGLSLGFKNNLNTWMSDTSWLFGMFGAMPNQWNVGSEGRLEYGSIQQEMKPALQKLQEWMAKGYISEEAGLYDEIKATELFTAGTAGIIVGPYWMTGWPISNLKKNVPNSDYNPYPLPAGPDGKIGHHGTSINGGAVLINKNMKNKDAFFVYQNYLYEYWANQDGEGPFSFGFARGYDYDLGINGQVLGEQEAELIPGGWVDVIRYTLTYNGAIVPFLRINGLAKLANGEEPSTQYEKTLVYTLPKQLHAAKIVFDQQDSVIMNMFTGSPTPTQISKGDILNKLEKEVINRIIYGKASIDEFDSFVGNYNSSGGEQITKEVNEWYDTIK